MPFVPPSCPQLLRRLCCGLAAALLLAAGAACAGTVVGWGNNPSFSAGPVPSTLGGAQAIGAGYAHSLAVRPDGTVVAWGGGGWNKGQVTVPAGLNAVVAVTGGSEHSLALRTNGLVTGWGNNLLGAGVPPAGLKGVLSISAGFQHSVVLKADGTPAAWGCGFTGCAIPAAATNLVEVSAGGYHTVGLRADGTVLVWDGSGVITEPALSGIVAVAGGGYHSLALDREGNLFAWGTVFSGQDYGQTNVPAGLGPVAGIAAGIYHNLVLRPDGTVTAFGQTAYGQCDVPAGLSNVVRVAAGGFHSLALVDTNSAGPAPGPAIVRQPRAAPTVQGTRALFSVGAVGAPPIAYQWLRNGVALPGATTAVLDLPAVTTQDTARYSVVVSNVHGTRLSAEASLLVLVPPSFLSQPAGTVVPVGTSITLTGAAAGVPEPSYQWQRNGSPLAGQTNAVLSLTNLQTAQAGTYTLVASNLGGSTVSSNAVLLVDTQPVILTQPASATAYVGDTATLRVSATGTAPLSYQWRLAGLPLPGQTNATLTLAGLRLEDAGAYSVEVLSPFFSRLSADAVLAVQDASPLVVSMPAQAAVFSGGSITLTGAFAGSKPMTYQWEFQGQPIPEATNAALVLTNVGPTATGAYAVAVSNRLGGLTSPGTVLTLVEVAAWGTVLSRGNEGNVPVPPVPPEAAAVLAVAQGSGHGVALRTDGTVLAWGDGGVGQTNVPAGLVDVVAIAAGGSHSLALRRDGRVAGWGYNVYGQASAPASLSNVVAVTAGSLHSVALRANGTVAAWGYNASGQTSVPAGLSNVVAVSAGGSHNLALRSDGTVAAWGYNGWGQTTVPSGLTNVVAIAAGEAHSLALRADGGVVGWGYNTSGQAAVPAGLSNVVALAGGSMHSVAVLLDGTVAAWGNGAFGQTNIPAGLRGVTAIAARATANLARVGAPPPVLRAVGPAAVPGGYAVVVPTESGRVYALEVRDTLEGPAALRWPLVAGTGGNVELRDEQAPATRRFYRVRRW